MPRFKRDSVLFGSCEVKYTSIHKPLHLPPLYMSVWLRFDGKVEKRKCSFGPDWMEKRKKENVGLVEINAWKSREIKYRNDETVE
jgi:hypothetical protein